MKFLATLALSLSLSAPAFAARQFANNNDETACSETSCVIFEVTISMNGVATTPIVRQGGGVITSPGNFANPYGTVVTRTGNTCSKAVRVPVDVFRAIMGIMRSLAGDEDQPPAFTPSQQTILLFYTTLMQQTLEFQCTIADLSGGTR